MLNPQLPGRGGRRQCRDQPGGHRRALRRAGRDGRGAGHDEQLHLRQRRGTSTTRPSAAAPAPAPGFDGTDAVQTHMTNSRLTDPEVLEWRFPVLVEGFAIRPAPAARAAWRGGDGVVRRMRFLRADDGGDPVQPPPHPALRPGGRRAGALGRNWVERADGAGRGLSGTAAVEMAPGDVFVIETPGGGGFGSLSGYNALTHTRYASGHGVLRLGAGSACRSTYTTSSLEEGTASTAPTVCRLGLPVRDGMRSCPPGSRTHGSRCKEDITGMAFIRVDGRGDRRCELAALRAWAPPWLGFCDLTTMRHRRTPAKRGRSARTATVEAAPILERSRLALGGFRG